MSYNTSDTDHFDPLPSHEQIIRRKPLPEWWNMPVQRLNQVYYEHSATSDLQPRRKPCRIKRRDPIRVFHGNYRTLPARRAVLSFIREHNGVTFTEITINVDREDSAVSRELGYLHHYGYVTPINVKDIGGKIKKVWITGNNNSELPDNFGHKNGTAASIHDYLKDHGWVSGSELKAALGFDAGRIYSAIKHMYKAGKIIKRRYVGNDPDARLEYALPETDADAL